MSHAEPTRSAKRSALSGIGGAGFVATLCSTSLLTIFMAIAPAQERKDANTVSDVAALAAGVAHEVAPSAFDVATLPASDSIDAKTDIAIFLQDGVPAPMQ